MFFELFENIVYDQRRITDISKRVGMIAKVKEHPDLSFEYQVTDGELPEHIAYNFYGDSGLHWVILLMNDIIDPYYGWVLGREEMLNFLINKYGDLTDPGGGYEGVHHYEWNGVELSDVRKVATVVIDVGGTGYVVDDILTPDWGALEEAKIKVTGVSVGEITTVELINAGVYADTPVHAIPLLGGTGIDATATFTFTVPSNAVAVSNQQYEENLNEQRRRIKILYPEYLNQIKQELEYQLEQQ